jgi:6-phosphogluconolactonase
MMHTEVETFADALALGRKAREIFVTEAREAIAERGKFFVAISGGKSPETLFAELGESIDSLVLDWSKVRLFWVDERCVGPDSEDSNYRLARDLFVKKVGIPDGCVFRMRGEEPDGEAEARRYGSVIGEAFGIDPAKKRPRFDLIFMGMGADGHTASLFPGSDIVHERQRLARFVPACDQRLARITLTPPALLAARRVIVLVSGSDRAMVLRQVLTQQPDILRWPVQLLFAARERAKWLVDTDAAKLLGQEAVG